MKKAKVEIVGLLLALILTSCATTYLKLYEGPERPRSEIAIVTIPVDFRVVSVDGVKPKGLTQSTGWLKMLPGKHTLTVSLDQRLSSPFDKQSVRIRSTSDKSVTFTAEAGKSYVLSTDYVEVLYSPDGSSGTWSPSIKENLTVYDYDNE